MALTKQEKETTIIFNEADEDAEISTANRKWINKLVKLVEEGHAEELEPTVEGHRDFALAKSMIRVPFYREPRVWTEEQREAARERLAAVRAEVAASRGEDEEEEEAPKPKPKAKAKKKAPAKKAPAKRRTKKAPAPPVEEEEDIFDESEEEEEEEVVVRKPRRTKKAAA